MLNKKEVERESQIPKESETQNTYHKRNLYQNYYRDEKKQQKLKIVVVMKLVRMRDTQPAGDKSRKEI